MNISYFLKPKEKLTIINNGTYFPTGFVKALGVVAVATSLMFAGVATAAKSEGISKDGPTIQLKTEKGVIKIRLFQSVAPKTVAELVKLIQSPSKSKKNNQYDQLKIMYTVPHLEIHTEVPTGLKGLKLPKEINAESLGLDKKIVKNSGEAMDLWQFSIIKRYRKHKRNGTATPALKEWMKKWDKDVNADFLIGKSMKEIYEAIDYAFTDNLISLPVKKGSVLLKPAGRQKNSAKLVITLTDYPNRLGKWAVIGEVIEGLPVADAISVLPNSDMMKPRFIPKKPVTILKTEVLSMR